MKKNISSNTFFEYVAMFEDIERELEQLNTEALINSMKDSDKKEFLIGFHSGVNAALQLFINRYYGDD